MRELENYCVGCPQGCIHCGREVDVEVVYCDVCGDSDDVMYEYDGMDYCEAHLFEKWIKTSEYKIIISLIPDDVENIIDYVMELLEDPAGNYDEIYSYLDGESQDDWNDFKSDCKIDVEEDW